jgi:hypothetical protein
MRRTIRLTGRRQLPRSCAAISIREVAGKKLLTFTIADQQALKGFPLGARLQVRLDENKQLELVDLGTLGAPKTAVELQNQSYIDPTCELRIAMADGDKLGLLLGSTRSWRLNSDSPEHVGGVRGLLNFLPGKIAPRTWKLNIDENAHPIIQIDSRIPDPRSWAKSDPVFVATIMPAIIHQIFDDILSHEAPQDTEWMKDWLQWADGLMPGRMLPEKPDVGERRDWINDLIDSFCNRHKLSDRIVDRLIGTGGMA